MQEIADSTMEYLCEENVSTYKTRSPRPNKLGPYKRYLTERVRQARPTWLPATLLLREIHERG